MNQSLFLWFNHAATAWPDWLWASLTITAHTSMVFALATPLLRKHARVITALFVAAALGGVVVTFFKEWLRVLRPAGVLLSDQFYVIGQRLSLTSFPSGHTMSAFAVAALLTLALPNQIPHRIKMLCLGAIWLLALLLGLSRIAVGAHWPLDILGGAVLGVACGWVSWWLALRLHRQSWTDSNWFDLVQAVVLGSVSASLWFTQMGYPQAAMWQNLAGLMGVVFAIHAIYASILQLKSAKST